MFSDMLGDIISLQKPDGTIFEKIKASVQGNKIFIFDMKLPLEENDKIYRKLPNGLIEVYLVLDRGFINDPFGGAMTHYEAKVEKENSIKENQYKSITVNLSSNSRININSTDNSVNNINSDDIFENIRQELQLIKDEAIKVQAIKALDELKTEQNKPAFSSKYMKFIAIIADHITLAAPLIQALARLIH